jgi:hypothetical protein
MPPQDIDVAVKVGRAIDNVAERKIKRVAFAVHGELVKANPVDTGWSRANWLASVGTPPTGKAASKGSPSASGQGASLSRLLVYRLHQGTIWISNHVPYIRKLNEGHSKQAGAGWVERAVDAGVRSVNAPMAGES